MPTMNTETQTFVHISMAAASDTGTVREENEDYFFFSRSHKFMVVCDGMGGHQKGARASRIAGETLRDLMLASEENGGPLLHGQRFDIGHACKDLPEGMPFLAQKLVAGIRLANRHIVTASLNGGDLRGMGTTLSAAAFHKGHIVIAHVGDSRVYRLRNGQLAALTTDHSWLNELIEDNEITEEQVQTFRQKNVLTRALGTAPTIKVDLTIDRVQPDDLYLICTDGLHNALSDELIQSILCAYHGSLENKIANLVKSAKLMDGGDNITGGLIHISGVWQPSGSGGPKKLTVNDESAEVTSYLDHFLKNLFRGQKGRRRWRAGIVAFVILLATLLALGTLLLYRTATSAATSRASSRQVVRPANHRSPAATQPNAQKLIANTHEERR